jgi:hypothetical protein
MRWFRIREANNIDPELRKTFERYGTVGMQVSLGDMNHFKHQGQTLKADMVLDDLLAWLTEQSDKTERKETWSLMMEIAITILVAAELVLMLWKSN